MRICKYAVGEEGDPIYDENDALMNRADGPPLLQHLGG
jgi:hypothetical protein